MPRAAAYGLCSSFSFRFCFGAALVVGEVSHRRCFEGCCAFPASVQQIGA